MVSVTVATYYVTKYSRFCQLFSGVLDMLPFTLCPRQAGELSEKSVRNLFVQGILSLSTKLGHISFERIRGADCQFTKEFRGIWHCENE